jgi:hypothetical protein
MPNSGAKRLKFHIAAFSSLCVMFLLKPIFFCNISCVVIVIVVIIVVVPFQLFTVASCFYFRSLSIFIVTWYVRRKFGRSEVTYDFSEPMLGPIPKMSAIASRVLKRSVCVSCTLSTVLNAKYVRVCVCVCVRARVFTCACV